MNEYNFKNFYVCLLYNLEKQVSNSIINEINNNINIKNLKIDYELSHPLICINLWRCKS